MCANAFAQLHWKKYIKQIRSLFSFWLLKKDAQQIVVNEWSGIINSYKDMMSITPCINIILHMSSPILFAANRFLEIRT